MKRTVTVDRQWHGKLDEFAPVKYAASNREIPASNELLERIAQHIATIGGGEHGVLLHADGRPLNSNRFGWRWEITAREHPGVTFHQLRHHFASALIASSCSVVAVQQALGHASSSETLNTYGHLWPSDNDKMRAAIDRLWDPGADQGRTATA